MIGQFKKLLQPSILEIFQSIKFRQLKSLGQRLNSGNQPGFYDKYVLQEYILGQGVDAIVKLCSHNGQDYAVKIIRAEDTEIITRIENEIEIMHSLDHFNIIKLVDVFRERCFSFFLVQELALGTTLSKWIKKKNERNLLIEKVTLIKQIMKQLISAINYLHSHMICHRDIKTCNIVVQELKDTILIKLIDFGVSKMSATGDLITPTGTFKYKAPEIETQNNYSFGVDIWAAGVVLSQLLGENVDDPARKPLFNILSQMLEMAPAKRITAEDLLKIL